MKTTLLVLLTILSFQLYAGVIESTTSGRIGRKSQNCLKFGLCLSKSTSPTDLQIRFIVNAEKQTLEIRISVRELVEKQPQAVGFFESKQQIQFEEPIVLPEQLINQWRTQKQTIQAGQYTLEQRDGFFCIIIPENKLM